MPPPTVNDHARLQRQLKVLQALVEKQKAIDVLWLTIHNRPEPVEKFTTEFYFAVGDLREGVKPEDLRLNLIDKEAFLKELKDD